MTAATHSSPRRLAAVLVFVLLPLALMAATVFNAVRVADLNGTAEATEDQVARFDDRIATAGPSAAPRDLSVVFIEAASRSLADVALQRRLLEVIEAASARVIESGAADAPSEDLGIVEVRATLDTDNAGLLRLLHAIETGIPLLTVRELAVRRLQAEASATGGEPDLRIDLRVRGYWRSTTS